MAAFPSNLQKKIIRPGYSIKPLEQVARTDMEVGAPRTRRRTFARNDRVTFALVIDAAELAQLRQFVDNDINGGAAWFDLVLPGCAPADEARLVSAPAYAVFSVSRWKVDLEVEVR